MQPEIIYKSSKRIVWVIHLVATILIFSFQYPGLPYLFIIYYQKLGLVSLKTSRSQAAGSFSGVLDVVEHTTKSITAPTLNNNLNPLDVYWPIVLETNSAYY